jgi:2-methylisocitrate lyase-like PEP mutase family enzyme
MHNAHTEKANAFNALHQKGRPLVLQNIWDAGSARIIAEQGAQAIATSSWSMAAAQNYPDGEAMPFGEMLDVVKRIQTATPLPLTVDFECGYAEAPEQLAENIRSLLAAGVIGINFEDGINGEILRPMREQCQRIQLLRHEAEDTQHALFINARLDLFLQSDNEQHADLYPEAVIRAQAYAAVGASGIFVPGLVDETLIAKLCEAITLPVNIMRNPQAPTEQRLTELGVSRISYGPFPYMYAMDQLKQFQI